MNVVPLLPRAEPAEPTRVSVPGALVVAFLLLPATICWTPVLALGLFFGVMILAGGEWFGGATLSLALAGSWGLVALWNVTLARVRRGAQRRLRRWQALGLAAGGVAALWALLTSAPVPGFGRASEFWSTLGAATLVSALVLLLGELSLRWASRRRREEPQARSVC